MKTTLFLPGIGKRVENYRLDFSQTALRAEDSLTIAKALVLNDPILFLALNKTALSSAQNYHALCEGVKRNLFLEAANLSCAYLNEDYIDAKDKMEFAIAVNIYLRQKYPDNVMRLKRPRIFYSYHPVTLTREEQQLAKSEAEEIFQQQLNPVKVEGFVNIDEVKQSFDRIMSMKTSLYKSALLDSFFNNIDPDFLSEIIIYKPAIIDLIIDSKNVILIKDLISTNSQKLDEKQLKKLTIFAFEFREVDEVFGDFLQTANSQIIQDIWLLNFLNGVEIDCALSDDLKREALVRAANLLINPPDVECPVALTQVEDPVFVRNAANAIFLFDKDNLTRWLETRRINPLTNEAIEKTDILRIDDLTIEQILNHEGASFFKILSKSDILAAKLNEIGESALGKELSQRFPPNTAVGNPQTHWQSLTATCNIL